MTAPFLGSTSAHTRGRLAGPRFSHLGRDLYVAGSGPLGLGDLSIEDRVAAAHALYPDDPFGHITSLLLTKVPIDDDRLVHLYRNSDASRSSRDGIFVHRVDVREDELMTVRGLTLLQGPRTMADIAGDVTLETLVAVGDVLANRYEPEEFVIAVSRAVRRRGVELLREAVPLLDKGSGSPAETRARLRLHAAGFTSLKHKVVITDEVGGWYAEADLGDAVAKVALQHEGEIHFLKGVDQRTSDISRDDAARSMGWAVVNSTKIEDRDKDILLRRVSEAYLRQAQLLGPHVLPEHLLEVFYRRRAG